METITPDSVTDMAVSWMSSTCTRFGDSSASPQFFDQELSPASHIFSCEASVTDLFHVKRRYEGLPVRDLVQIEELFKSNAQRGQ